MRRLKMLTENCLAAKKKRLDALDKELYDEVKEFVQDKRTPLDIRWRVFENCEVGAEENMVEAIDTYIDEEENKEDIDTLKEGILDRFLRSFEYDCLCQEDDLVNRMFTIYHTNNLCTGSGKEGIGTFGIMARNISEAFLLSSKSIPSHWEDFKIVAIVDDKMRDRINDKS